MTNLKFVKDKRDKAWPKLEVKIQKRAENKDKNFILSGKWKKFVRKQKGFLVCGVNGEWLRTNIDVTFGDGGHGYVHEYIPLNEIWIDNCHSDKNVCKSLKNIKKASKEYFDSTVLHEIVEFKKMKKGMIYWKAHQIALRAEIEAGLIDDPSLKDPHAETD